MSLKIKSADVIGLVTYGFRLRVNGNIGPNSVPLRDIRLCNPSDLDFELSWSLKVKRHGAIALAINNFRMMVNSNIGPNLAPLQENDALKSD